MAIRIVVAGKLSVRRGHALPSWVKHSTDIVGDAVIVATRGGPGEDLRFGTARGCAVPQRAWCSLVTAFGTGFKLSYLQLLKSPDAQTLAQLWVLDN